MRGFCNCGLLLLLLLLLPSTSSNTSVTPPHAAAAGAVQLSSAPWHRAKRTLPRTCAGPFQSATKETKP